MDFQSPIVIALAVSVIAAVVNWAYAKFMLMDPQADKVLAKSLASGLIATAAVILYVRQQEPAISLQADPFFAPIVP